MFLYFICVMLTETGSSSRPVLFTSPEVVYIMFKRCSYCLVPLCRYGNSNNCKCIFGTKNDHFCSHCIDGKLFCLSKQLLKGKEKKA